MHTFSVCHAFECGLSGEVANMLCPRPPIPPCATSPLLRSEACSSCADLQNQLDGVETVEVFLGCAGFANATREDAVSLVAGALQMGLVVPSGTDYKVVRHATPSKLPVAVGRSAPL